MKWEKIKVATANQNNRNNKFVRLRRLLCFLIKKICAGNNKKEPLTGEKRLKQSKQDDAFVHFARGVAFFKTFCLENIYWSFREALGVDQIWQNSLNTKHTNVAFLTSVLFITDYIGWLVHKNFLSNLPIAAMFSTFIRKRRSSK